MAGKSTYVLTVDNKQLLKGLHEAENAYKKLRQAATGSSAGGGNNLASGIGNSNKQFQQATQSATSFWKIAGGSALGGLALQTINKISNALAAAAKNTVTLAGEYEKLTVTFKTLLGSAAEADKALAILDKFSGESLFTQEDIFSAGKRLLALKVPVDELEGKLKAFGDISAGTGRAIDELVTIYAKVQNQGRVQGDEMLQIAEAGIPIYDVLIKQLGISRVELNKMQEEGKITAEIFNKAFLSMGESGGLFFGLVEAQSNTFLGQVSKLQKEFQKLGREIGEEALPALKELVKYMIDFIQSLDIKQMLVFFSVIKDSIYPALVELAGTLQTVTSGLLDFDGDKIADNLLTIVDAVTLLIRGVDTIIQSVPGLETVFSIISDVAQGINFLIQDLARLTGGSAVDSYADKIKNLREETDKYQKAENAVINANNTAKTAVYLLLQANGLLAKKTKEDTDLTTDNAAAKKAQEAAAKKLADAIEKLNNAYDSLAKKASVAFAGSLDPAAQVEAMANIALLEIQELEEALIRQAGEVGRKITQEALNDIETLRVDVIKKKNEALAEIRQEALQAQLDAFEAQGKALNAAYVKVGEARERDLNELLADLDHLKEVSLLQNDLLVQKEEEKNRNILEIDLKYAQLRLSAIQSDPARKKKERYLNMRSLFIGKN